MPSPRTAGCTTAWPPADGGRTKPALGDWWGRALWALGVTAAQPGSVDTRGRALTAFHRAANERSPFGRAMAFAALGAADVLTAFPDRSVGARAGARRRVERSRCPSDAAGNGRSRGCDTRTRPCRRRCSRPGVAMDDPRMLSHGLSMLRFLVDARDARRAPLRHRHRRARPRAASPLSSISSRSRSRRWPTPARGHSTSPASPSGATSWPRPGRGSRATTTPPPPCSTRPPGAGFDGLESDGRNENRGAESTLAALSTYQQARRLQVSLGVTRAPMRVPA